jgi:hypothetical protein
MPSNLIISRMEAHMSQSRLVGPVGTTGRVIGGSLFVAVPIAVNGIDWWDVAGALVVLPLIATGVALLLEKVVTKPPPDRLARSSVSGALLQLASWALTISMVVGIWILLTFLSPFDGALPAFVFFGISMLLAATLGLDGCEFVAFPYLILGGRRRLWCPLYAPFDATDIWRARSKSACDTNATRPGSSQGQPASVKSSEARRVPQE